MAGELGRLWDLGRVARDSLRVRRARTPEAVSRARDELAARLGEMHGLPQKIGQLLSLGELGAGGGAFAQLAEGANAMPSEVAFAELERHLGRPWREVFASLDERGIAASIGQVHRGVLHDGRAVAVKIQHRGMADAAATDLRAFGLLAAPLGGWKRGFDRKGYQHALASSLAEELDYRDEAKHTRAFRGLVAPWPDVVVPEVVSALSGERVLVTTWLDGGPFADVHAWSLDERRAVGETLARLFFASCLRFGVLHADPNPGNFRFSRGARGPVVGVLDFGCTRQLPETFAPALCALVEHARTGASAPADAVLAAYVGLGFEPSLLEPMAHLLPALTEVLFTPLRTPGPFALDTWAPQARASELLGDYRWNFRFAGPPSLVFVIRAYRGLVAYVRALGVPLDWSRLFNEERGGGAPPPFVPGFQPIGKQTAGGASVLKVRVSEHGRMKVDLTFKAAMVEHLVDLVPEELLPQLAERGVDVEGIARASVAQGIVPTELFRLEEHGKTVRVWLA